jgi:beta-glucosidase
MAGPDVDATNLDDVDMVSAIEQATSASVVVVCLGEETYTEKPGDINDLYLPKGQTEVLLN